ncbi:hypothetical protein JCM8202_006274 [Rhodotorula sphaerocarpa]
MARSSDIILVLVAILFPPAAAGILTGCSCDLLINLCLTLLGYIPGHLHAFWLIWAKMQAEERYGPEIHYAGNAEWLPSGGYHHPHPQPHVVPAQHAQPPQYAQPGQQTTYGTA